MSKKQAMTQREFEYFLRGFEVGLAELKVRLQHDVCFAMRTEPTLSAMSVMRKCDELPRPKLRLRIELGRTE